MFFMFIPVIFHSTIRSHGVGKSGREMNLQPLSVILRGFVDSLSLHWALKYLAKPKILQLFLKVFVSNVFLLVGTSDSF